MVMQVLARDRRGKTAMQHAAARGHRAIAEYLHAAAARVRMKMLMKRRRIELFATQSLDPGRDFVYGGDGGDVV